MTNITTRNLSLAGLILSIVTFIGIIISVFLWGRDSNNLITVQFISCIVWLFFCAVLYRNYSQAVKEDKKYGNKK